MISCTEFHSRIAAEANKILRRASEQGLLEVHLQLVTEGKEPPPPFMNRMPLRREELYIERLSVMTNEVVSSFAAER